MRMDERSSKRARQQRDGGGMGLPAVEDGFGTGFPRASLVGLHLQVKPSQTHLFFGSAIELKVSLLNDEDVVQQMTQGINVSITTEDGKVVNTHPNMFEITPKHPALLDGTSTFQLLLWEGCVRAGNRMKVHVEAFPGRGGDQIKAYSEPIMVCRSALTVVSQPPENWYKDEGGKNNCISIDVMVREKVAGQAGQVQPGVPLTLALVYENGTEVHSQDILQVQSDTQLATNEHGRAHLKFKITEVSQRHQSQRFCIKICPDIRTSPECSDVAPVVTVPVMVLSKRKNRRLKAEKQAQSAAAAYAQGGGGIPNINMASAQSGLRSLMLATAGVNGQLAQPSQMDPTVPLYSPSWGSPAASSMLNGTPAGRGGGGGSGGRLGPGTLAPHQHHTPQPPSTTQAAGAVANTLGPVGGGATGGGGGPNAARMSAPVEEVPLRVPPGSTGALSKVFSWTNAVLQLLQMELQWEHIGYEHSEHNGSMSADYSRPLYRCPVCRVCKGPAHPHQKHAPDCKLRGLLGEFSGRTSKDFLAVVREQQEHAQQQHRGSGGGASPSPPPTGARGGGMPEAVGGRPGGGAGVLKEEGFRVFGGGEANGAAMRMAELARGPASAIASLKSTSDGSAPGEGTAGLIPDSVSGRRGEGANVVTAASSLRGQSGHFLPGVHSNELLTRGGSGGMSRGLSIGFSGMFDNSMVPTDGSGIARGGGDKGSLARSGSVAPFVPQRSNLTPAEEQAHFIMLPTSSPSPTAAADGGGGGGVSSKHLTVFSEKGILLGFYEEKYDVGQQTHFPFQGFENNFSVSAKRDLELRLQAALEEESRDAQPKKRDGGGAEGTASSGRPTRSSMAAVAVAAAAAAEAEAAADAKKESLAAAGYRKVYKLADFKGYQEMKEQVLNDWCLGQKMDMTVFESETSDAKAKNNPR